MDWVGLDIREDVCVKLLDWGLVVLRISREVVEKLLGSVDVIIMVLSVVSGDTLVVELLDGFEKVSVGFLEVVEVLLCSSDGLEVNEELELTTVVTVGLIKEVDGIEIELEGWVCRVVPNGIWVDFWVVKVVVWDDGNLDVT